MSLERKEYTDAATELQLRTLTKIKTAPIKREWNPVFRVSIPSINDIKREFNQRLGTINELCVADGHNPLYMDPDDEDVPMDSFK